MPPIPPPDASGFTQSTDVPLYWVRYGKSGSKPLLVLHGGPGAHHDYLLPQLLELARLGDGHELFLYDQRGGGKSRTDARDPITWRTQVADVGAVVREFGLERPIIVGYSWGGLLAMLYAAEAATDQDLPAPGALVLIDPASISRAHREAFEQEFARRGSAEEIRTLRLELADSGLRESDPEQYRHRNFELSVAGYFLDPEKARDLTPFRVSSRVQQSVWDSLGDFDFVADGTLARIQVPTLIVHGRQDPIPIASSEEAAQAIGARLVPIDECGHVPYVEQPEQLFAAIDAFLREQT